MHAQKLKSAVAILKKFYGGQEEVNVYIGPSYGIAVIGAYSYTGQIAVAIDGVNDGIWVDLDALNKAIRHTPGDELSVHVTDKALTISSQDTGSSVEHCILSTYSDGSQPIHRCVSMIKEWTPPQDAVAVKDKAGSVLKYTMKSMVDSPFAHAMLMRFDDGDCAWSATDAKNFVVKGPYTKLGTHQLHVELVPTHIVEAIDAMHGVTMWFDENNIYVLGSLGELPLAMIHPKPNVASVTNSVAHVAKKYVVDTINNGKKLVVPAASWHSMLQSVPIVDGNVHTIETSSESIVIRSESDAAQYSAMAQCYGQAYDVELHLQHDTLTRLRALTTSGESVAIYMDHMGKGKYPMCVVYEDMCVSMFLPKREKQDI